MSAAIKKNELFDRLGYGHPRARALAHETLVQEGLTRAHRSGISEAKAPAVLALLKSRFIKLCPACLREYQVNGRSPVPVAHAAACERCGGSTVSLAVNRMVEAMKAANLTRLVVVGGTPNTHRTLMQLTDGQVEIRLVSGTGQHNRRQARMNLEWADLVVVWGPTPLKHRVSRLYTRAGSTKVFPAQRRGIEALCSAVMKHLAIRSRASAERTD